MAFLSAVKIVLAGVAHRRMFVLWSLGIFTLLYMVPVWTTPGNTIAFHFTVLPTWVLLLMIALAILNGLLITMQHHIRRNVKHGQVGAREAGTALGILVSAFVSTIACAACYSSVLALLGLGATAFIVKYQALFGVLALGLTIFALHLSVKRIENKCSVCAPAVRES